jgi:UPF0716 protein FxsA
MRVWLLAMLLGFPLLEVVVLARLAETGGWWVLAWVVLAAAAGVVLLKEARFALLARLGAALASGQYPIAALIDSARTVLAGLLLILPGVVSDALALGLLLLPRAVPAEASVRAAGSVYEGRYRRER